MTDRNRLIDLLDEVVYGLLDGAQIEAIAEHLLENGVILPLVKVGGTVYCICGRGVEKVQITAITQYQNGMHFTGYSDTLLYKREIADIGKTVFLTEADAKKALKERDR
jgi:hypothetical protein